MVIDSFICTLPVLLSLSKDLVTLVLVVVIIVVAATAVAVLK
jgi:hypothetical protein